MTFLINLAVLGILCSFTLVLEGKAGKDIPVSSRLEKTFDSEEKTSAPLNKEVNSRFTFAKNSFSNSPKVTQVKFRGNDRYYWFISVFTFDSLKNYFLQQSLAYLNFTSDVEDLFCWYKRKKWFLWAIAAAQTAEKDGWGLTWYSRWGIYLSIPTWTHSQNSMVAAEASGLKISSHGTSLSTRPSQSTHKRSHKIYMSYRRRFKLVLQKNADALSRNGRTFANESFNLAVASKAPKCTIFQNQRAATFPLLQQFAERT